jgi:hypothetical protein
MKVCVVIVHFGSLPEWFSAWLATAASNSSIDFHLFLDADSGPLAKNVFRHEMTLAAFNRMDSVTSLGLELSHPYKFCDFRPAIAKIFAELIAPYDYWGWGDLDVLYGDIRGCLSGSFGLYDYIATGWNGMSGPLAFLRNGEPVNSLFEKVWDWRDKMNNPKPLGLDEIEFLDVLKQHLKCDIVVRECFYDLPALLQNGSLVGLYSKRDHVLYHFGGNQKKARKSVSTRAALLSAKLEAGDCVYIGRRGRVCPGSGRVRFMFDKVGRRLGIL